MMVENNFYVVARELYNNEKLTVVERAGQIAAAFTTMIEAGVGTMADFEAFINEYSVNIGYNDQAQHVTTVKHPNDWKAEVINFLNQPGSTDEELGLLRYTAGGGYTWMKLTAASIPAAIERVEGMDVLAPMEKEVLINALKQVRNA